MLNGVTVEVEKRLTARAPERVQSPRRTWPTFCVGDVHDSDYTRKVLAAPQLDYRRRYSRHTRHTGTSHVFHIHRNSLNSA